MASGVTFRGVIRELTAKNAAAYNETLERIGPMLKKSIREALIDGFKDGQGTILRDLVEMGVIEIQENEENGDAVGAGRS